MEQVRVAIYTLTRDRIEFTDHCFRTLWEKAGAPFDHFVVDNGSKDDTVNWLEAMRSNFKKVIYLSANVGISKGSNLALDAIKEAGRYDLIIKFDNDCEVVTEKILQEIVKCFEVTKQLGILSPRVEGIVRQPVRTEHFQDWAGHKVGRTGIVGGLFHIVPGVLYQTYRYPENLPLAKGQDDHFCDHFSKKGITIGYIEDLVVKHYLTTDGQAKKYPEYFKRKFQEEK